MAQEGDPQAHLTAAGAPLPVLYSFRRCPYAMRARMAIAASGQRCELREVVLRSKPAQLLGASPKGTVPVLVDVDGSVLEQSLEIMLWALRRHDPGAWLAPATGTLGAMLALIAACEGEFKPALDGYKYPQHAADGNAPRSRAQGELFLQRLEDRLDHSDHLFGAHMALADAAIAPFVRQFAHVDRAWFDASPWQRTRAWLDGVTGSALFDQVMGKYPAWTCAVDGVLFPPRCDADNVTAAAERGAPARPKSSATHSPRSAAPAPR